MVKVKHNSYKNMKIGSSAGSLTLDADGCAEVSDELAEHLTNKVKGWTYLLVRTSPVVEAVKPTPVAPVPAKVEPAINKPAQVVTKK